MCLILYIYTVGEMIWGSFRFRLRIVEDDMPEFIRSRFPYATGYGRTFSRIFIGSILQTYPQTY